MSWTSSGRRSRTWGHAREGARTTARGASRSRTPMRTASDGTYRIGAVGAGEWRSWWFRSRARAYWWHSAAQGVRRVRLTLVSGEDSRASTASLSTYKAHHLDHQSGVRHRLLPWPGGDDRLQLRDRHLRHRVAVLSDRSPRAAARHAHRRAQSFYGHGDRQRRDYRDVVDVVSGARRRRRRLRVGVQVVSTDPRGRASTAVPIQTFVQTPASAVKSDDRDAQPSGSPPARTRCRRYRRYRGAGAGRCPAIRTWRRFTLDQSLVG